MTKVVTEFYISTGKLNAMFTLRRVRTAVGLAFDNDHYICNLAGANNEEGAIAKARDYFERMFDRMGGNTEEHSIFFNDCPEVMPRARRGKLSVRDTAALEQIEAGRFPFGKHAGKLIADGEDGYVLYWSDQAAKADPSNVVIQALAAACTGVALERDLIAKRQAARDERAELDAKSVHVGEVGQRIEFEGEVVSKFYQEHEYEASYYIMKIRCGGNLISYIGNGALIEAERGDTVKFKATIKGHSEYKGVKETKVNRPKVAA